MKLLTHITRNVRVKSGFRIGGSRVLHDIIRTLCLSVSELCFCQHMLYSQSGSLEKDGKDLNQFSKPIRQRQQISIMNPDWVPLDLLPNSEPVTVSKGKCHSRYADV